MKIALLFLAVSYVSAGGYGGGYGGGQQVVVLAGKGGGYGGGSGGGYGKQAVQIVQTVPNSWAEVNQWESGWTEGGDDYGKGGSSDIKNGYKVQINTDTPGYGYDKGASSYVNINRETNAAHQSGGYGGGYGKSQTQYRAGYKVGIESQGAQAKIASGGYGH